MIFFVQSDVDAHGIARSLGKPQYSYYFLECLFRPVLEELGPVVPLGDHHAADLLHAEFRRRGEECLFVSFSPPHLAPVGGSCPTLCVFAWEFERIPDETWDDEPRNDWRSVFRDHGRTITLCRFTAQAVSRAMGPDFPVAAIPAPVFDRLAGPRSRCRHVAPSAGAELPARCTILDTRSLRLDVDAINRPPPAPAVVPCTEPAPRPDDGAPARRGLLFRLGATHRHAAEWYRETVRDLLPGSVVRLNSFLVRTVVRCAKLVLGEHGPPPIAAPPPEPQPRQPPAVVEIQPSAPPRPPAPPRAAPLQGIVYTSVFNPRAGLKNWHDIVTAFCWTLRDAADATLVLKMAQPDGSGYGPELETLLARLSPFSCRVVALAGLLEESEYHDLIAATSFYVNASLCEGLCIPLLDFLSCGAPVIAPRHTAMADYVNERCAFVVQSSLDHAMWPHDSRRLYRTLRYRVDWSSLAAAFRESHEVARNQPDRYRAMSVAAIETMRDYCSDSTVKRQLSDFLRLDRDERTGPLECVS